MRSIITLPMARTRRLVPDNMPDAPLPPPERYWPTIPASYDTGVLAGEVVYPHSSPLGFSATSSGIMARAIVSPRTRIPKVFRMFFRKRKPRPSVLIPASVSIPASVPSNVGAINVRHPIPPKLRFAVLQRDEFTCQYCGAKGPEAGGSAILEIDHRVPVSRGGTNDPVNLVTSCWHCNRGKGATRLHAETFPEQNDDQYQWETCRIEIQLTGTLERQTIILRADRYGAGKKQTVVKPKEFHFRVALPKHQPQELSWAAYWLYLPEKERRILQQEADGIEKRLLKSGWRQVSNQEYRRRMK